MALSNKELIKKAYERIIEIGWDFSSKKYMDHIVFQITNELKQTSSIAKSVIIDKGNIQVLEEIERFTPDEIGQYINELLKKMGVRLISLEFKNNLEPDVEKDMISSGVKFEQ